MNNTKMNCILTCRRCKKILLEGNNSLKCPNCQSTFPLRDGIVCYESAGYYFGEVPQDKMHEIIQMQREHGSQEVSHYIKQQFPDIASWLLSYMFDPRRSCWVHLLRGIGHGWALDYGCGWGSISVELSKFFRHVVAVDRTLERLEFTRLRALELGVHNVYPILGFSDITMPFVSHYFDLVVLNGVLEYIGVLASNPRDAQLQFLRDVHRVLRKDGSCYIGIENRTNYQYFLGAPDHSHLRYAAILPRRLANIYSQCVKKEPYKTFIYSLLGYKKLLLKAGFRHLEFYVAHPDYRLVTKLMPLSRKTLQQLIDKPDYEIVLRSSLSVKRLLAKMMNVLGLFKYFVPNFSIYAYK